ncbi:facilitated trehalose transporter Tret1-like [Drosophila tropicalis]|uniref:facilitated trehalose transporter Tret1-like n=1 Tax=Drosophila tropicalis TaxID=46794 RepID=UPI0035ABCC05
MVHTSTENRSRTFPQYVAALAAAGGAFACGTLLGWTSPAQTEIVDNPNYAFPVNDDQFSWVSSAMTLGAACVCIPIGFLINMIGRKWTMLFLVLPFLLGWGLLIWAKNLAMMYSSRFILGIAGGAFCVTAPMYTGEIAQKEIRGTLGSFFQLMIRENKVNVLSALNRPVTRKALAISLGLMFFQQVCGINAVIFYSKKIFEDANTGIGSGMSTILVGVMQVVATFVSTLVVDKLGRRILLLASGIVMALSTTAIGVYFFLKDQDEASVDSITWLPVTSLCVFIIMFSIGYGPVPWLMMGGLFATDIKGFTGSIAGTTNWVLAFIVAKTFTNLNDSLGAGGTFWLFAGLTVIGVFFVFFAVPETKGKSLNEIQAELAGNRSTDQQIVNKN